MKDLCPQKISELRKDNNANIIDALEKLYFEVENLKIKTSKPDKHEARGLLAYIKMDVEEKKTFEKIIKCDYEYKIKWLNFIKKERGLVFEEILKLIISGEF